LCLNNYRFLPSYATAQAFRGAQLNGHRNNI
jgi:hypothetical protein